MSTALATELVALAHSAAEACDVPFAAMVPAGDEPPVVFGTELAKVPELRVLCRRTTKHDDVVVLRKPMGKSAALRFCAIAPVRDPDGTRLGSLCVFDRVSHDLTEAQLRELRTLARLVAAHMALTAMRRAQREAATASHWSGEQLRLLMDSVADYAIYALDPSGRVTTWNDGATRLTGYSAEEALGSDLTRFYTADDDARGMPKRILARARSQGRMEDEGWRVRKDGTKFWANAITYRLQSPDGKHAGFVKVIRDMTERRKLEQQLHQAQKMESLGSLASGVAHDFNNILTIILSYSAMAARALPPEDPVRAEIEEIGAAGLRAADLTRQLLAFSRQQAWQPGPVALNEVLAASTKMLRRILGEDVELTVIPGPKLGTTRADASQVEQVLLNLVVNARDAMPRGGRLTIETKNTELDADYARVHVGVKPGQYVALIVTDTGAGMDAETQQRIFEPFFTTKGPGKGTGLGLSTVFGIVRQSGGHVWVYSEPGEGTTFKVYFPRVDGARPRPSRRVPVSSTPRRGSETVLLVEDDDSVRALVNTILRRHGYHVLEARTGGDALVIAEQHRATIDLLLTDVVMPRMSGRELADRISRMRNTIRVLFMSGYADGSIVHHGVLDSGVHFLQKPITPQSLIRKLREVLDASQEPAKE